MPKCGRGHCLLRLPRFRILVAVLHQLLRVTNQQHNQVNLFLCRTITTTAQAISRALAESLLSLLSSLHSSGGNTNMAATSGYSSGPSNSTHYPASSSSGTPCSTSQSSGTLVVRLNISTYISFDGPSVVSTLPRRPPQTCL